MKDISINDKIVSLKREVALRKTVYPRLVSNGRLTQTEADRELTTMTAILQDYLVAAKDDVSHLPLFK